MAKTVKGKFPCPLCSRPLEVRTDRSGKPYCVCNSCGHQWFIRGKRGIERLRRLLNSDIAKEMVTGTSWKILLLVNRLEELKAKEEVLGATRGFFNRDKDVELAISMVKKEINGLRERILELRVGNSGAKE